MKANTRQQEPTDYYAAGYYDGINGIQADSEDPDYEDGYRDGQQDRARGEVAPSEWMD